MTILSPAPDHEVIRMVLILLYPAIGTSVVLHTVSYGVLLLLLVPRACCYISAPFGPSPFGAAAPWALATLDLFLHLVQPPPGLSDHQAPQPPQASDRRSSVEFPSCSGVALPDAKHLELSTDDQFPETNKDY